jgi:hypothetical protein
MANRKVSLLLRVKTADGKRPYLNPACAANCKTRRLWAIYQGQAAHFPSGTYYLRYKQGRKLVFVMDFLEIPPLTRAKSTDLVRWQGSISLNAVGSRNHQDGLQPEKYARSGRESLVFRSHLIALRSSLEALFIGDVLRWVFRSLSRTNFKPPRSRAVHSARRTPYIQIRFR